MGRDTELITLIKSGSPEGVKKYLSKLKKSGWIQNGVMECVWRYFIQFLFRIC